jgi:hypothetical protein
MYGLITDKGLENFAWNTFYVLNSKQTLQTCRTLTLHPTSITNCKQWKLRTEYH